MLTVLPHQSFVTRRYGPTTTTATGTVPGAYTTVVVIGTISAASPSDIARLEEGKRSRQCYKLFTASQLQTALPGGLVPDWVQVGSTWFEVSNENPWQNGVFSHFEYLIVKVENP